MENQTNKPTSIKSKRFLKFLSKAVSLILDLIVYILNDSLKNNAKKPGLQARIMGEKIPMSDKYYIPDDK